MNLLHRIAHWLRAPLYDEVRLPTRAEFAEFVPDQVLLARLERAARNLAPDAIEQAWQRSREQKARAKCDVVEFHGRRS